MDVTVKAIEDDGCGLDLPNDRVAATAEQSPHPARVVTMVDHQIAISGVTKKASSKLCDTHGPHLVGCESILTHKARTEVFRLGSVGVSDSPVPESVVALSPVRLTVGAISHAHAGPAFPSPTTPIRERFIPLINSAGTTNHRFSIARLRGMASADQPCHADVLLGLANTPPQETPPKGKR